VFPRRRRGPGVRVGSASRIARTGTHLFLFARYVEQFRGWGRGLRTAVGRWYTDKGIDELAYQVVKYRQREGWSHRDLLRLSHPVTSEVPRAALFDWISGRASVEVPPLIAGFQMAQSASTATEWEQLVTTHGLSWEMLPDAALGEPKVWDALLDRGLPMTALIRQLPRLTRLGVARDRRAKIARQLTDQERLRKARIHPVNVLVAQRTYASGRSARGESTWTPDRMIVDALDAAFYASFGTVEPTGKRTLLALDVSGSMAGAAISNLPLTAREASAALALVTAATEPDYDIVGFTGGKRGPVFGRVEGRGRADWTSDRTINQPTATVGRRYRCRVQPPVRRYRLRLADGPRLGDWPQVRHVRHLHRQRDVGRCHPSASGVAEVPPPYRD
jgi:60 kDa SS-A/Ro ribonucleoprotein